MESLKQEIKIIDSEKIENRRRNKRIWSIAITAVPTFLGIASSFGLFEYYKEIDIPPGLIFFLAITYAACLFYYFVYILMKAPGKGKMVLTTETVKIILNNTTEEIKANVLSNVNLYKFTDKEEGSDYWIEFDYNNKVKMYELDLIFQSEIDEFSKIIRHWQSLGVNIEVKKKKPQKHY